MRAGSVGERTGGGSDEGEYVLLECSVAIKLLHDICSSVMDKLISSEALLGEPRLCNNENNVFTEAPAGVNGYQ